MIAPALLLAALLALLGSAALGFVVAIARPAAQAKLATAGGPSMTARRRSGSAATVTTGLWLSFALLASALAVRTVAGGRAPWSNLHEFSQAFAAAVVLSYLLLARRHAIGGLAPLVALLAAGLVALAISLPAEIDPLVPALQQPLLLTFHVGSAVLAYAISGVAFIAAVGELAQRRAAGALPMLPSAEICRAVGHRAVLVSFPILTAAIFLGAVWANLAWRSYWSNDPKEVAAVATWLVYAGYLHVAGRRDGWGALAPWLLVLGFGAVLFTFLAVSFLFPGQHSYAGA